ncbi:MAG: hypothetical protein OEL82_12175 [Nitrosopumilus sp.]|nr:hypothetical protein [Nitrosopumilus sp.]MDH5568645.1 hypothetical protein [Nitrosopumilus sp.]
MSRVRKIKNQYSLILIEQNKVMKVDGSKIIFGLGVSASVTTAIIVLYFSIR